MSYLFDQMKQQDGKATTEDKILLMGLQQAGKTAIKDVVFFGKLPGEVEDYMATIHYERQFIDEEKNSLIIDSGGQESYWNEAVTHFRHLVFSNVKLLIWVVDVTRPDLFEESERRFSFTIRQFKKENPEGYIAVLCHKVDMITPEELVPILQHIKDSLDEPKYNIRFEASSIYYSESLKELVFHLMKEANMNIDKFELVTSISSKIEESDEFQSYMMQNDGDPRIRDLLKLIDPTPEASLPTYGKVSLQFDLSAYEIIEIILVDKDTLAPVIGASSPTSVSIEKSMDYIIALQDFKALIRDKKIDESSGALIATSSNEKVHTMIFNLENNYLLITSFSEITKEKTQAFYRLLNEFTQKIGEERVATPDLEVEAPIISKPTIIPTTVEVIQKDSSEIIAVDALPSEEPDETSMFSFLNKLRDDQSEELEEIEEVIEEVEPIKVEPPIIEEQQVEVESELEVKQPPIVIEEEIEQPEVVAPKIDAPAVETPVVSNEPEPPIEEVVTEKPTSSFVQALKQESQKDKEKVAKKPSSRFVQLLKEESIRYKVKQVELAKAETNSVDSSDQIQLEKEDIAQLAEYLKEKSAEEEES